MSPPRRPHTAALQAKRAAGKLGGGKSGDRAPTEQGGLHQSERVPFPVGRAMRLAVVADTHSLPHPSSLELVAAYQPDAILHAGDIGALTVIDQLKEIAPTILVRGNIDGKGPALPDTVDIMLTAPTTESTESSQLSPSLLTIMLLHIGVYGPKLRADAARTAHQHNADVLICGHSHVPFIGRDKGLVVFNPGSIGPRRFMLPITFGTMEVSSEGLKLKHIDCETGEEWSP